MSLNSLKLVLKPTHLNTAIKASIDLVQYRAQEKVLELIFLNKIGDLYHCVVFKFLG